MKIFEPKEGAIYWCTLPVDESAGYGDTDAKYPWEGKYHEGKNGVGHLYSYSKETGEIDDDSNAKALVKIDQCAPIFDTEQDAIRHYIHELDEEIDQAYSVVLKKTEARREAISKLGPQS